VDAPVNGVALSLSCGTDSTWLDVVLVDVRPIAVHLAVDASGQAGHPGPDDDNGFLAHSSPFVGCLSPRT